METTLHNLALSGSRINYLRVLDSSLNYSKIIRFKRIKIGK